jgi:hypothetical protein
MVNNWAPFYLVGSFFPERNLVDVQVPNTTTVARVIAQPLDAECLAIIIPGSLMLMQINSEGQLLDWTLHTNWGKLGNGGEPPLPGDEWKTA